MTAAKGAFKTVAVAGTASHTNPRGVDQGALYVTHDTYEAATLVTGSTIEIGTKLPLNAYVHDAIVGYDAMGSSTSFSLGDSEDPDRYITNTATTSAGVTRLNAVDGMGYKCDETQGTSNSDRQVLITTVDSGSMSNTIKATVFWSF